VDGPNESEVAMNRSRRARRTSSSLPALTGASVLAALLVPALLGRAAEAQEFRVLQMNLCHSGVVSCYTGDAAINQAIAVIQGESPDIVSLNEVCRADVPRIGGAAYAGWFTPARRPTGETVKCTNGDDYGIAMLHKAGLATSASNGYTAQDSGSERRVWMCSTFADGTAACVTHLSTSSSTAMKQCKELLNINMPAHTAGRATVVAGDFNLRYNQWNPFQPNVQDCVPSGFFRKGDGSVQHIMAASARFNFVATEVIGMAGTTDHPALLVRLTRR
jgi:hypothetical protein